MFCGHFLFCGHLFSSGCLQKEGVVKSLTLRLYGRLWENNASVSNGAFLFGVWSKLRLWSVGDSIEADDFNVHMAPYQVTDHHLSQLGSFGCIHRPLITAIMSVIMLAWDYIISFFQQQCLWSHETCERACQLFMLH